LHDHDHDHEQLHEATRRHVADVFERHALRTQTPPSLSTLVLTTTKVIDVDHAGHSCMSIGVINPNNCAVYWGVGGSRPQPGSYAVSQPPRSLMVLPFPVQDFPLGADAAELATLGAACVLQVLRFNTLQPCFLGAV
jgi:hypothetical protein